jgi:aqualysin 1
MKRMLMFCAALLLSAATLFAGNPSPSPIEIPPDKIIRKSPEDRPIPGSYIVVLDRGVKPEGVVAGLRESKVEFLYNDALSGFAGEIGTGDLKYLAGLKEVIFIEEDAEYEINEVQQPGATWGLDRVEQRFLTLDGSYWYYPSIANPPGSFTTHAYVIDTGIAQHPNFGGRFLFGPGQSFTSVPGTVFDCHGHGTHVAGTIGSITYGVSKQVALHSVRVLNCAGSGTLAGVVAGVNWVTGNAVKPAVANMSLGGGLSPALNTAVDNSVLSGVFYAVAAGNNGANACSFSPSSSVQAFAVSATDINDQRPFWANFGPCVDIFAPGDGITSLWLSGGINTISGTSMASPHVAGAAALYLAQYPWAAPAQVRQALVTTGTTGIVGNPGVGSPNLFVFSRAGSLMASFNGTITAPFQQQVQPLGVAYFTGFGGLHEARLTGPAGTNFDLELWEWSNALMGFNMVAISAGATSTEHVIYHSTTESLYFWIVRSVAGVGPYTLRTSQP